MILNINNRDYEVSDDPNTPLLWVLRDSLDLTGSKYGCGIGQCGACTVHIDGRAVRSCTMTIRSLEGKKITTIEGLAKGDRLHPVQEAWVEVDVPQCGYCQTGQIMSAAALLDSNSNPSEEEINRAMRGNVCRCGTYPRIKKAIQKAAESI